MRIGCRLLTLKITVFSVWKTTLVQVNHRISSKIIRNLQIIERITYTWIAFSQKFDSIKLQTFRFENMKFKVSAQSEWSTVGVKSLSQSKQWLPWKNNTGSLWIADNNEKPVAREISRHQSTCGLRLLLQQNCFQDIWFTLNYIVIKFRLSGP